MAQKVVLVEYQHKGPEIPRPLNVRLSDGTSVPMDEFLKTHKAVGVSALTHADAPAPFNNVYLALMIAEEDAPKAEAW